MSTPKIYIPKLSSNSKKKEAEHSLSDKKDTSIMVLCSRQYKSNLKRYLLDKDMTISEFVLKSLDYIIDNDINIS